MIWKGGATECVRDDVCFEKENVVANDMQSATTWRGRRDLNPRAGFSQPTPLAGEPLRPLGYFCVCNCQDKEGENLAERVGFEPTDACASPVFKTGSFNRSDISP